MISVTGLCLNRLLGNNKHWGSIHLATRLITLLRSTWLVLAGLLLGLCLSSGVLAEEGFLQTYSNDVGFWGTTTGGVAFGPDNCPTGQILTGLSLWERTDADVGVTNRIQAHCRNISVTGGTLTLTTGADTTNRNGTNTSSTQSSEYRGDCDANQVAVGFQVTTQVGAGTTVVSSARMRCAPLTYSAATGFISVGSAVLDAQTIGTTSSAATDFTCPAGQVVGGISGRMGWYLDQLVTRCYTISQASLQITAQLAGGGAVPTPVTLTATTGAAVTSFVSGDKKTMVPATYTVTGSKAGYTLTANTCATAFALANTNQTACTLTFQIDTNLAITKTHVGNFTQGQTGATYTLTVANASATGAVSSSGTTVTVTDTLPTGLSFVSGSGTGWNACTAVGQTVTCTRDAANNALAVSTSYPAITLTVNVASNTATSVTNTASVALTGQTDSAAANNTVNDVTTITALPDLTIAKAPTGTFTQGVNATYTVTVSNSLAALAVSNSGTTVTVTDTLPTGMTFVSGTGTGWNACTASGQTVTCTRSAANNTLAANASYPAITLTVSVASTAAASLTNNVSVALSGQTESTTANNSASAITTIVQRPDLIIAKSHSGNFFQGQTGVTYTVTVSNSAAALAVSNTGTTVTVTDTLPTGLTFVGGSGTGWNACTAALQIVTCTRSAANNTLAAAASYPNITLTVNVTGTAAASVTNNVSVALTGQTESLTTNNSASDATTVDVPIPTVTVNKVADVATVSPGGIITYTITITNSHAVYSANSFIVKDVLSSFAALQVNFSGGLPVQFIPGTSGLGAGTITYYSDNACTVAVTPTSAGGGAPTGFDSRVLCFNIQPTGTLTNNNFQLKYAVKVQ